EAVQKLPHRALERVGKPNLLPPGRKPAVGLLPSGEVYRAGRNVRIRGPADRSFRHTLRALHAPADVIIRRRAFASRSGPDVVPGGGPQSARVLKNVKNDAVSVFESRPRISSGAQVDAVGVSEQEPESVQVMNAHVQQRQAVIGFEPGLPVRDGAHFDRRQHGLAKVATVEQRLESPDRLVIAHVVVDGESYTGLFAQVNDLPGL